MCRLHQQPTDGGSNSIAMPPVEDGAETEAEGKDPGEEVEEGEEEGREDGCSRAVGSVQDAVYGFFRDHTHLLWTLFYLLLLLLYAAYFIGAMVHR